MDQNSVMIFRQRLRQIAREMSWSEKSDIQCCGVSMAQCYALLEIGQKDEISIVELAALMGLDTSTLSRTIDNLVKAGLVNRVLNPQDRRYVTLTLTGQGATVFKTIADSFGEYVEKVFEFIPIEKHVQVMDSLMVLADALSECNKGYECCKGQQVTGGR